MTKFQIGDEKVSFASKHQQQLLDGLTTAKLQKKRMSFSQIFKPSTVVKQSLYVSFWQLFQLLKLLPNTSLINNALHLTKYWIDDEKERFATRHVKKLLGDKKRPNCKSNTRHFRFPLSTFLSAEQSFCSLSSPSKDFNKLLECYRYQIINAWCKL